MPPAQCAQLLAPGLVSRGVIGECPAGNAKLASNKGQCCLRNDLARAQQAPGIAESTELQRETKLVRVAATTLYGGEIGDTQGPVPDQFGFGDRQGKQLLELLAATARRLGMANCPSTVRARTEATGCGRSSGESAIETARHSLLSGLYRRSVLHPAEARSGPHVVRAGYEVVGAFIDLGMPARSSPSCGHAASTGQ